MKRRHTTDPNRPRPSRVDVILYQLNSAIQDEPSCADLGLSFCVTTKAVEAPTEGDT
jgi:hypothetical protein